MGKSYNKYGANNKNFEQVQDKEQKESVERQIIETHPGTIPRPKRLLGSLAAKPKPLPPKQSGIVVPQKSFSDGPVSNIKIQVNTALPAVTTNKPLKEPSANAKSALNQFTSLFNPAAPAAAPAAAAVVAPVANTKSPFNQFKSALGIATNVQEEIKKKA